MRWKEKRVSAGIEYTTMVAGKTVFFFVSLSPIFLLSAGVCVCVCLSVSFGDSRVDYVSLY